MKDDPMNRLKARRGSQLTHAKLHEDDVRLIHELVEHREELRRQAQELRRQADELTDTKIGEKFGVHNRTIGKIAQRNAWTHVEAANG